MIELLFGGARSGKSAYAETQARIWAQAREGRSVVVIATAEGLDVEMRARIAAHRADRDPEWRVIEEPRDLAGALRTAMSDEICVIVDCLTLWLSNHVTGPGGAAGWGRARQEFLEALRTPRGRVLLVANEVGLGLVPQTPLGRDFRDEAGRLNQQVAALADKAVFIAAGLPLVMKGAGGPSIG